MFLSLNVVVRGLNSGVISERLTQTGCLFGSPLALSFGFFVRENQMDRIYVSKCIGLHVHRLFTVGAEWAVIEESHTWCLKLNALEESWTVRDGFVCCCSTPGSCRGIFFYPYIRRPIPLQILLFFPPVIPTLVWDVMKCCCYGEEGCWYRVVAPFGHRYGRLRMFRRS